ncbi:MAG: hypothetical protein R2747_00625 [Pyrinomonadaceae bacterium]
MRKIRLSPIEREILWTLKETGEENPHVLKATVEIGAKDFSEINFSRALKNLLQKECIRIESNNDKENNSVILTGTGKLLLTI